MSIRSEKEIKDKIEELEGHARHFISRPCPFKAEDNYEAYRTCKKCAEILRWVLKERG